MADVDNPGPSPEDPYGYTGRAPKPPPEDQPPSGQSSWQPPEPVDTPKKRSLWVPTIVGCLLTWALVGLNLLTVFGLVGTNQDIGALSAIGLGALVVTGIILLFPVTTRTWGGGLLIGLGMAIAVGLVVLAGVCVVVLATYDGGGQ